MSADWITVALDEVAEFNPRLPVTLAADDNVSFVPMSAVSAETAGITHEETRTYAEVAKGYTPFVSDDVLVAKITPCFENGKIVQARLTQRVGFGSTEFHVVRPHADRLDARYTLHFLRLGHVRLAGERRMTGSAGQRRVPENFLAKLEIPLPPLAEQRRIAEVLDRAEALRAKRRAALAQLDSLTQSLFLDLFGDPATNPKGWSLVRLGQQTLKIGSGSTPTGGETAYKAEGISLIRSLNVRDGEFTFKDLAFIGDEQAAKLSGVVVEADDVLLNITGASVARVCRAPSSVLPARVNQHVCIIRPKPTLNAAFLEQFLLATQTKRRLLKIGGAGATREAITKAQIELFEAICPPIQLQREFARRVTAVEKLKTAQRASLAELDALFATLQHRAFCGELGVPPSGGAAHKRKGA